MNKPKLIFFVILFLPVVLGMGYYVSQFYYINTSPPCFIKVSTNVVSGIGPITVEINNLQSSDKAAYENLCRYVDHIVELPCLAGDTVVNTDPKLFDPKIQGCFVKGSKTIYLKPLNQETNPTPDRVEALKRYATISKEYWSTQSN